MAISRSKKFLKSIENGRVFPFTTQLSNRIDMIECDSSGKALDTSDMKLDKSDLDLRGKIKLLRKRDEVIDFGARYDVEFADKMTVKAMKDQLIQYLESEGEIDPIEEE